MSKVIMVGCDLHDRSMFLKYAVGTQEPLQATYVNDFKGRLKMILELQEFAKKHKSKRIVFVYEASGLGFGLCDQLHDEGIECHVLSPTHLPKTVKSAKQKTDEKDAQMLLEQVRGFVLAGNSMPVVWTPPQRLRDDRDLVRARIDLSDSITSIKLQVLSLLKRHQIVKPEWFPSSWTKVALKWLKEIPSKIDSAVAAVLLSYLARYESSQTELKTLDNAIQALSKTSRYKVSCEELRKLSGVGLLTAMTFVTEMGDLNRFKNRREIAAYLGICPASYESGEANDRKGHITRQGPARLRRMLCQAAWAAVNHDEAMRATYERIRGTKKGQAKKAIVAIMRRLSIVMWHVAQSHGVSDELIGRGGPHGGSPIAKTPSKKAA